ncbi:hypothetical protein CC2G_005201 [Coprinopsis cinerea AmutBmut pab1-1]|nr:hypothetical protein CC2G_005201 [Coprinopsis cinerea AmutBmut pab1-1]
MKSHADNLFRGTRHWADISCSDLASIQHVDAEHARFSLSSSSPDSTIEEASNNFLENKAGDRRETIRFPLLLATPIDLKAFNLSRASGRDDLIRLAMALISQAVLLMTRHMRVYELGLIL